MPSLRMLADRFDVRGVYNSVSSLADRAAREFDARSYSGFREMIASPEIDALLFLESGWFGTEPIYAACEFGKAIYCGSEVKIEPQFAEQLRETVDNSGIAFMAEYPRRLAPATLRLKELIATTLGKPEILFCHHRVSSTESGHNAESGERNAVNRELVELIDWCSFVAGQPVAHVHGTSHALAKGAGEVCETPDYVALTLKFAGVSETQSEPANQTMAQISCGSYIQDRWREAASFRPTADLQVYCENGLAFLDLPNNLIWFDEAGRHQEMLDTELPVGAQLLTQFHRAVTSLVRKMADLNDVCYGLRTLQVAHQSIEKGAGIELETRRSRPSG